MCGACLVDATAKVTTEIPTPLARLGLSLGGANGEVGQDLARLWLTNRYASS